VLGQKFPAETFTTTTLIECKALGVGDRAGLVVFGLDYATLTVKRDSAGWRIEKQVCSNAHKRGIESSEAYATLTETQVYARVRVDSNAVCCFSYSTDGKEFIPIGNPFTARAGLWVGAKIGLFVTSEPWSRAGGYADFDWFRFK
jgi:hypothetical protein